MGERIREMGQARLLIVEDERIMAEDLKARLETMGFRVVGIAVSGQQALELAERERPDLAIMDIQIKGPMNGIETAQILRDRFDCAFIYLTAYADRDTLDQIRPTAPHGFILKPFDSHELLGVLETALYKIQIEKDLRERASWLSSVLRSMGDGLVAVNPDGRIMLMNAEAETLTGWTQDQARDRFCHEVVRLADESTGAFWTPSDSIGGDGDMLTLRLFPRQGEVIPVEVSLTPMKDEAGHLEGKVWLLRNISARREAEWAVQASEERYRRLYESITDAVATMDMEDRIVSCNEAFCTMLGYSRDELLGKTSFELTPEEWHGRMQKETRPQILDRGFSDIYEKEYIRKNGRRIVVELRAFLLRDARGEPQAIWALIRDITARKSEERAILDRVRRLERQEAALIRLANDSVLRDGSLEEALAWITQQTVVALDVDRASVWFVSAGQRLVLRSLTDRARSSDDEEAALDLNTIPAYWRAVSALRTLDVADVRRDPRTPELVVPYCEPLGIGALLDSSIRLSGEVVGVFCAEHRGEGRSWYEDERVFLAEIADQVAQILLHQERLEAEAALRESERNYREIFNATGEIVLIHDAETGQIIDINQTALDLLDCTYDEALTLFPSMNSADPVAFSPELAKRHLAQAVKEGSSYFLWKVRKKDGSLIWLEVTMRSAVIGAQPRVLAVGRDITEKKETEIRLARAATFRVLVMELSTQFINLPLAAVRERLEVTLQRIGQTLECRRCGLFRLDLDCGAMGLFHLWQAPGLVDIQTALLDETEILFQSFGHKFARGETLSLLLPDGLPAEAESLRIALGNGASRSWILPPLVHENILTGCLLLEIDEAEPQWSEVERDLLTVMAELFTSVLVRADAEARLQASEERFRKLADLLPQPIYESDLNGRILYANQTAYTVFHVDPSHLERGIISYDLLSPEDREAARENSEALIRQGELPPQEYMALRPNGQRFPVMVYSNLIVKDDKPVGFRGIVMDITQLRRTEEALSESEEKYRHLVERANDGVAIVSEGQIRFVNQPICQMLGMTRDAMLGQPYADFVGEEDRKPLEANVRQRMQGEPLPSIFEISLRNREGHLIPVEVNVGLIPYQGRHSAFVFIRDIRERRKVQEALRTAQQTHHLASLGTLAAGISHEINQPLMALKVKVDSMLYWGESDEALLQKNLIPNLQFISTEADKIDAIIRHMRSLIRMEKVVSGPLDIHEAMTHATQLIGQRLKAHGIQFELVLSRRMPQVMAHATSIEQVVINLVANAMFALDETDQVDKWIQVKTRKHGRFCRIEVRDNGPGIPEAHLGRIFDSLFTTRENGEGMGLGLPIVQYLLSQIGGSVHVANRPEGGACFTVDLPLAVK